MADIEAIVKGVVAPLKTTVTSTKVVRDAWRLELSPEEEYMESEVALEKLEFAASALGGLGAAAAPPAAGAVRSSSTITVPLADSSGGAATASLTVTLYGPGDLRAIELAQVIRRHPAPGTTTAEETVLTHIEFDRPELPWAFSPAPQPGQPVKPWLTLIVVPSTLVEWEPAAPGTLLPVVRVPLAQLPPLDQSHLWAHAQASRNIDADKPLDVRLSPAHAPVNLSRLVSPRVLRDSTAYIAAVVPTIDVGVRGGLGVTGGTLDAAWGPGSDDPVRLPVYHSWEFATGPDGDFKELALRLQGVVAPYEVGRRFIDASAPGKPLRPLGADEPGAKQVLRCALFSPTPPSAEQAVAEAAMWPDSLTSELRAELDRPAVIEGAAAAASGAGSTTAVPDLPIIGPRIYAKLHRGAAVIEGEDWFADLNLAPTKRIIAGLGTRVVQKDQEPLMQAAWAQLGEVQKANRAIALAQLAELLATRLHTRVGTLDLGRLVQVTAPAATRVSLPSGTTISAAIDASATPSTVKLGAYRRVTRPGGPMVRRADDASRRRAGALVAAGAGLRDFTRVYHNPEGVSSLSADVVNGLELTPIAHALDLDPAVITSSLESAASTLDGGGVATHLTHPERWSEAAVSFDLGRVITERWAELVRRPTAIAALEEVRAQRVRPLIADLEHARPAAHARAAADAERVRSEGGLLLVDGPRDTSDALDSTDRLAATRLSPALDSIAELSLAELREGLTQLADPGQLLTIAPVPRRDILSVTSQQLHAAFDPKTTVRQALNGRLRLTAELAGKWLAKPFIEPIMAAPRFRRPMYRALDEYDRECLVPGMSLLPETDFVTVLSTNDEFVEAFLVGLSDEFGHELLWRGYPTDRRGTYFHRFWSLRHDELTEPIHAFRRTPLGTHVAVGGGGATGSGRAVIVVKSELVRRFPDLIIQAIRNQGTPQEPVFETPESPQQTAEVLFAEHLEPDIALVGVGLSVEELDGPGWWIVIAEHPSATRFELPAGVQTDDHLSAPEANAAAVAYARLHHPTRVAFEATDFIVRGT